jgi:hypothetical protein
VNESEWLGCTDPTPMLEFLANRASHRKMRLFAVACCRRTCHLLPDERHRKAVDVAERFSDGQATDGELAVAEGQALDAVYVPDATEERAVFAASSAYFLSLRSIGQSVVGIADEARQAAENETIEQSCQANLLRDIFGPLPFRPVTLDPAWLTPNVQSLAESIYTDRTFERLPILADALSDAGCNNEDILNHCRQPGVHVRGCWALDSVLGKE